MTRSRRSRSSSLRVVQFFSFHLHPKRYDICTPSLSLFSGTFFGYEQLVLFSLILVYTSPPLSTEPFTYNTLPRTQTGLLSRHTNNFVDTENTNNTLLLPSFCHRERFKNVKIRFRVGKIFDLLDLQASVIVWSHVRDEDRFAIYINPDRGLRVVGDLWDYARGSASAAMI